jgi:hypothetical protein
MKTAEQTPMRPVARSKPPAARNRASDGLLPSLEGIPAGCKLVAPEHAPVTASVNLRAGGRDIEDALGLLCSRFKREVLLGTW